MEHLEIQCWVPSCLARPRSNIKQAGKELWEQRVLPVFLQILTCDMRFLFDRVQMFQIFPLLLK